MNEYVPRNELFALLYFSLFLGMIFGNWLPIADLGNAAPTRMFEIAILFLLLSAVMTWLSGKRTAR